MKKSDIIERINDKYLEYKMHQHPYTAPELLPQQLRSSQAKAIVDIFAEIIEELTEQNTTAMEDITEEEFKERNGVV